MLPRLTRRVFIDLMIWMVVLGLLIGLVFPFFVLVLGVPASQALSPKFFVATLFAGFVAGWINYGLAQGVIRPRLKELSDRMGVVDSALREATYSGDWARCEPESCTVTVDSEDEIGDAGLAFNGLVQTMAQSQEVVAAVSRFSETLSSQLEFATLTRQALDLLLEYSGAEAGAILVETSGELKTVASRGFRDVSSFGGRDIVRNVFETGEAQSLRITDDLVIDGVVTDFRPRHTRVSPIMYNRQVFGVTILSTSQEFAADTVRLLDLFRQGLGLALHNAMAHERIQLIAAIDPLTSYYNRRFGTQRLHEEFGRAVRSEAEMGLIIFDIDHFKRVNDTYGHLAGDKVLARVAQVARQAFRDGDVPVRYGGEEFCVVLPGASIADCEGVAERVRRLVEETEIPNGEQSIRVTVSVGLTAYPEMTVEREEDLFERADQALYQAKKGGRNQVVVAR